MSTPDYQQVGNKSNLGLLGERKLHKALELFFVIGNLRLEGIAPVGWAWKASLEEVPREGMVMGSILTSLP